MPKVQAAHTLGMSFKWWYDTVSLSTRPVHAAYMRVICKQHSGSYARVTVHRYCNITHRDVCIFRVLSLNLVHNINREPLYLLRQS